MCTPTRDRPYPTRSKESFVLYLTPRNTTGSACGLCRERLTAIRDIVIPEHDVAVGHDQIVVAALVIEPGQQIKDQVDP